MKGCFAFCFLFLSMSAAALEDGYAKYVGGTVPAMTIGDVGQLDTTSETSLTFLNAGKKLAIPYASIESYEYSKEVTRHLGVLPTIAVGLVKGASASTFLPNLIPRSGQSRDAGRHFRGSKAYAAHAPGNTADSGASNR